MRSAQEIGKELRTALWDYSVYGNRPVCHHEDVKRLVDELEEALLAEGYNARAIRHVLFGDEIDEENRDELIGSGKVIRRLVAIGLESRDIQWRYWETVKKENEKAGTRIECAKGVVEIDGETANVKFAYDQQLVSRIKAIAGRRWNPAARRWEIPASEVEKAVEILGGRI